MISKKDLQDLFGNIRTLINILKRINLYWDTLVITAYQSNEHLGRVAISKIISDHVQELQALRVRQLTYLGTYPTPLTSRRSSVYRSLCHYWKSDGICE